ncbi:AI-2E family transporter [Stieleria marina]|uniref:AI-2 transport protein TqsA n=1 Tax=Stieleria marina TaxID=1930275 RepID=A0A517NM44_9BACT|nr:AI-2 transport protein TqsA [Planctomycetes bacterium K23_9]
MMKTTDHLGLNPKTHLTESRVQTICLIVIAVFAAMYAVYWLRPVLVPFVVSVFVVSGLVPILSGLEKRLQVNRLVAAMITLVVGMFVLAAFVVLIGNSVTELRQNSDAYLNSVEELVGKFESQFPSLLSSVSSDTDQEPSELLVGDKKLGDWIESATRSGIGEVLAVLAGLVSSSIVVLIYVFFLLIGSPSHQESGTVLEIVREVRTYLRVKTVISALTGLVFGLILWMFGVPMAFVFGLLAFLLNFIPNVGPLFATLLPIPLIVLAPDASLLWIIACITIIATVQAVSGNIVEPRIMGQSSDLHPVTILTALMFWGMMWGLMGMFLATPITSVIKLLLDRSKTTQPIANLMAGRWNETTDRQPTAVP